MKKGIEWLKEEIGDLPIADTVFISDGLSYIDSAVPVMAVYDLIDKLDEQEVLSHKWISDHIIFNEKEDAEYIYADKLQNLLVPKQEEKDMQYYWREATEFLVNERVFGHEGRDYIVIEKPVIPKYVGDWIEAERGTMSNWKLPSGFISDSKYKKDQRRYKWSQVEGNMDKFMSALINGYEVEEAPLYCALIKGYESLDTDGFYWIYDKYEKSVSVSKLYSLHDNFLTEMSKSQWNELGINDSNAEFVKVKE